MALSPLKSIKAYCFEICSDRKRKDYNECRSTQCPLYAYRAGKGNRAARGPMSEEHKAKLREGMAKAREAKKANKQLELPKA